MVAVALPAGSGSSHVQASPYPFSPGAALSPRLFHFLQIAKIKQATLTGWPEERRRPANADA